MSKGIRISITLDQETYDLLCKLEQQLERSKAETIAAALHALAPRKASREFTQAETDAIFDAHSPKMVAPHDESKPRAGLGKVKGRSDPHEPPKPSSGIGTTRLRSKPRA
jgi:hypothetical protein